MSENGPVISSASLGACPLPQSRYDRIALGHGSGGLLTSELIQRLFLPAFGNDVLAALEDQATVCLPSAGTPRIATLDPPGV